MIDKQINRQRNAWMGWWSVIARRKSSHDIGHTIQASTARSGPRFVLGAVRGNGSNVFQAGLMPSSHLPRTPCDKFVYDFPCDFLGIVGGYGLRHMCSYCLRASCDFFYGASRATRGKSEQRLCGDFTEIVQCQCSCRAVSAASARKS